MKFNAANVDSTRTHLNINNCNAPIKQVYHELVIQIGKKDDTGSATEIGEQAKLALDEYFQSFHERNQWVQSEKEQLAQGMECYGFEWEHLSIIEFKKQERAKAAQQVQKRQRQRSRGWER
ncbi:MAG TPA: hypothetical protein PKZ11_06315 [Clostridia bacterium]|jgi:hypothetical protein|nr:hypothetical protein [Clostridia bacterium]HQJ92579.1 hypothetical protein [Clostridia bacterium]